MIATDLNLEKLKTLKEECSDIRVDHLDVTKGSDVEEMLRKKYPEVNVLFNCAG